VEPKHAYHVASRPAKTRPGALLLFIIWLWAALPERELARLRAQARRTLEVMPYAAGLGGLRPALETFLKTTED
jgi:hypothetical protein